MRRTDGTPFNRETERERWEYVEAFETRLLRQKTVYETVQELEFLYAQNIGVEDDSEHDEERLAYLTMLQGRLAALKKRHG